MEDLCLDGWNNNHVANGGKEIMINTVLTQAGGEGGMLIIIITFIIISNICQNKDLWLDFKAFY